ncbi:MAG: tRNA dihydrouridine synthase DusB, partial [Thermoanaerobaculia bacterium]
LESSSMLKLGDVPVDPPLFLAPMAGVTDRDFRLIVRRIGGVGVVTMEFISSKGLMLGDRRIRQLLHFSEEERPISIQIYGSDPDVMAEAAREVEERGADVCDINMGCPANKILKGCSGARLMDDLPLAERIIAAVRKTIRIPLTVKFRLGFGDDRHGCLELGRICEAHGVAAVALHPRTAREKFRGRADWRRIAELKEALSIPVIGNGDVATAGDAVRMLRETGCDGVMIGRGATRNPWIFRQIAARLSAGKSGAAGGPASQEPELEDRRELILDHFRTVIAREERGLALHKLRTFTSWDSHGIPRGVELRRRIQQLPTPESFLQAIEEHIDSVALKEAA